MSRILFRMSLDMDVSCATYSVRLAMDHVEGFVLCLQVRRGFGVIDLLFSNQYFMLMEYLCVCIYI